MTNKTLERIEREAGVPGLAALLAGLPPTDLQSLLLEVYREQAQKRQPAALLADYERDRFVRPSGTAPEKLLAWEQAAYASLPPGFETISLSPVCPLGTNSAVALVDQHRALSTSRNNEVVSDSTNVLALECALRRRGILRKDAKSAEAVHLATSHRLLRTQNYGNPKSLAHFSAFALCSSGRVQDGLGFERAVMAQHIGFYLRALRHFSGRDLPLRVALTDFHDSPRLVNFIEPLFEQIWVDFPGVECVVDDQRQSGRGYYLDFCFHVYAATESGDWLELADGGAVDWTQKLLSNAKERCIISGIGSERVVSEFSTPL